ncbi:MAG: ribosome biogenesis GTPase Der [Gammaproteobacteria bacterium]|nr:ribosome biogenesis GTPase Der [Gammaproteobacteria bacterium]MDH3534224.1 ribosome biogenesis GTPase Der [Gammaproteobacteria bacterium]
MIPVIALIGRPNVGKSTLFNVFTRSRDAIVANEPGLTRDRQYGVGERDGKSFIVIDTGGLSGEKQDLDDLMARQTRLAMDEADEILFIVDAQDGLANGDRMIADLARKAGKTCRVVINKTDGMDPDQAQAEFYALGFEQVHAISAAHRKGTGMLLDRLLQAYPPQQEAEAADSGPLIAVVGRPNVGKSTLINRLVGSERVVTFDQPGTTRDTISVPFERHGKAYTLIDTAGVRRRGKVQQAIEKFSVIKALEAIERSQVVILVIDAREGLTDQDMTLLGYVLDSGRALVIAVNKWDGLDSEQREQNRNTLQRRLSFVSFAAQHFISARHGTGVGELMASVDQAYSSACSDFNTRYLTDLLEEAVFKHNPPLHHGRRIKLRYAHQGGRNPPIIVIHGNQTQHLPAAYLRYLTNFYIARLKLKGTPLRVELKSGKNPFAGKKRTKKRKK